MDHEEAEASIDYAADPPDDITGLMVVTRDGREDIIDFQNIYPNEWMTKSIGPVRLRPAGDLKKNSYDIMKIFGRRGEEWEVG